MTGGRNEYLSALAIFNDDPRADTAIAEHERFALRAYAGHPPAWLFWVWASCNLTLLRRKIKPGRTPAETPSRPIAVGEAIQQAFATALNKAGTNTSYNYTRSIPDAAAARHISVSDAAGQLVHGFRASLECSLTRPHPLRTRRERCPPNGETIRGFEAHVQDHRP